MAAMWIAAGIGVGGIKGRLSRKAGDEAADAARLEAEMNWQATQEEVRRLELTHDQIIDAAYVDAGAMGFSTDETTSTGKHITNVENEFTSERQLALETGQDALDIANKNADLIEKNAKRSAIGSVISGGIKGVLMGGGQAGWWAS